MEIKIGSVFPPGITAIGLFISLMICLEIGRRLALRRGSLRSSDGNVGIGTIDGAIFALLGLLIAFTFSGAANRFDMRRELIVKEANALGTAWLRVDLLPAESQPAVRDLFRKYLDLRLEFYQDVLAENARETLRKSDAVQAELWARTVAATSEGRSPQAPMLLLPALNEVFDIRTSRTVALLTHPPMPIFAMLGAVSLISALLAGHGMAGSGRRSLLHMLSFGLVTSVAVFVILDLEYPRAGWIRIDMMDQVLRDLRQSFG
ncbi:MAG: hypothetical protein K1X53_16710 [Candidatus Sumerlaeaceae bacterium]|nr:hypothetical protein [Candidatus Sumerlaeaceae bacterium]